MLQTSFKNYDEFKELFVRTKDNGETCRKNGVLLTFLKSKELWAFFRDNYPRTNRGEFKAMADLYPYMKSVIERESRLWAKSYEGSFWNITIIGRDYYSNTYAMDGRSGICVDGDFGGYRYKNMQREGRVFKMKIGKMYRHLIDLTRLGSVLPESVKLYLCEEMTREWEAYAASRIPDDLTLHIDDDFESIYDCGGKRRCEGGFGSCMQDAGPHWEFYRDAVKAKAAYLTRGEDDPETGKMARIVARCVIFTEVKRHDTGEIIRVAERQYSYDCDETLQRVLIQKLKDGGHIDAYKKTGAGCSDSRAIVDINGNSMSDVLLSIECNLEDGDYLSYQDSFKWYDEENNIAYNRDTGEVSPWGLLSSTSLHYESPCCDEDKDHENERWSEYNNEWINEDDAVWVESRDDYFYDNQTHYGYHGYRRNGAWRWIEEDLFEDDCIYIEGEYYYAGEDCEEPEDYGLERCPYCEEWMLADHDGCEYSELLDQWFCDEGCREGAENEYKEENWYYSDLTEEYYETESELAEAEREWHEEHGHAYSEYDEDWYDEEDVLELIDYVTKDLRFSRTTIFRDTLMQMVEDKEAVLVPGTNFAYAMDVLETLAA